MFKFNSDGTSKKYLNLRTESLLNAEKVFVVNKKGGKVAVLILNLLTLEQSQWVFLTVELCQDFSFLIRLLGKVEIIKMIL